MPELNKIEFLRLEKAEPENLKEIQDLFVNSIRSVCSKDYETHHIDAWTSSVTNTERWLNKIKTQSFLIAKIDNRIVGFASLEKNHLDFLYVHPDFQRIGIAHKLYEALEIEAIHNHVSFITSEVSITARSFFEKMNFDLVSENIRNINGVEILNFKMKKTI